MKELFTVALVSLSLSAAAQHTPGTGNGCGTVTPPGELEKIYDFVQHNPAAYHRGSAGVADSVPLAIHIVGTDAGMGYYPLNILFPMLCRLNERFTPVGFHYYIKWPITYIDNSNYYEHDYWAGDAMMRQYNVPDAVNVYFVKDPSGSCGYYTYGQDAVAISTNCAGINSTTVTHELGHFFSLPHTFSGWEGGNTPANPERIVRSGPTANCNSAGDGFCDTEADYYSSRWPCPGPVGRRDANGDLYRLDSSMYMSYSSDNCQSRFSEQQIATMQYNLHTTRNFFSGTGVPQPRALDSTQFTYPTDTLYANLKKAFWNRVPGADYYYVRVSSRSLPTLTQQYALTTDTTLDLTLAMNNGGQYILQVAPVNAHNFCLNYTTSQPYVYASKAGPVTIGSVNGHDGDVRVFPNPLKQGKDLSLSFNGLPSGSYKVTINAVNGQLMSAMTLKYTAGSSAPLLNTANLPAGVYMVRLIGAHHQVNQKLLVQP
jgi:hypothetical protein